MATVQIGIVGDFDLGKASHWATEAALFHAARRLGVDLVPTWTATEVLSAESNARELARFDGILAAPGSPYASLQGMLRAIEFARTKDVPFLGTCGGFQYALLEFTRNVLGLTTRTAPKMGCCRSLCDHGDCLCDSGPRAGAIGCRIGAANARQLAPRFVWQ